MEKKRLSVLDVPSEWQECKWFWEWGQLYPLIADNLIHHANEGQRSEIAGMRLKMIGLRKGLPDYQIPLPVDKYHSLWIEMKRRNGRNKKKCPFQDQWIEKLNNLGHYAAYAYGWIHAQRITTDYLDNKL